MANIVQTYRSLVSGNTPTTLLEGQLAVNVPDSKIWIGNELGAPVLIYDPATAGVSDHTLLSNIGVNTHDQIDAEIALLDAHLADVTTNPHAVTAEQVGAAPTAHTHVLADVTDSKSMAAVDDAVADGLAYGRKDNTWVEVSEFGPEDVIGGQGITVQQGVPGVGQITINSSTPQSIKARFLWEDSGSGTSPGDGNMGADQATSVNMTQLVISYVDADGNDVSSIASMIKAGDSFIIAHEPTGDLMMFMVDSPPVDNTTWGKMLVTFAAGNDALNPAAGDSMKAEWFPSEGEPTVPAHRHDHNVDLDNAGSNTHAAIDNHLASTANPHAVTAAQAGAEPANANIQAHIADVTTNPHAVTYEQLGGTQPAPLAHNHDAGTF